MLLELHSPRGVIRVKKRPKLYPPPAYVQTATNSLVEHKIKELAESIAAKAKEDSTVTWEIFKRTLAEDLRKLKYDARKRMTNGYRQRIQRIKRQLAKIEEGQQDTDATRADLLEALHRAREARRASNRRVLVANNAWSSKASTKRFFRRVCNKYGDNTIPTLVPKHGGSTRDPQDKANILANSWTEIFNGDAESKDTMD